MSSTIELQQSDDSSVMEGVPLEHRMTVIERRFDGFEKGRTRQDGAIETLSGQTTELLKESGSNKKAIEVVDAKVDKVDSKVDQLESNLSGSMMEIHESIKNGFTKSGEDLRLGLQAIETKFTPTKDRVDKVDKAVKFAGSSTLMLIWKGFQFIMLSALLYGLYHIGESIKASQTAIETNQHTLEHITDSK